MESLKCIICNETKDVSKHYGVISCFGCKAFFRRTINGKRNYKCCQHGSCDIEKDSRNRCRACRFDKCKKVGMRMECK